MANELNIRINADENYLYCNGQAIGISLNSTYATIMEFIEYLIFQWSKDKCEPVPNKLARRIKRYWYSGEQIEQLRKMKGTGE